MAEETSKPRIQELEKFSIFSTQLTAEGKKSRLSWGIRDGNPRITVFTNTAKDTVKSGVIYAGLNPETFYVFLELFEKIILETAETKMKIDCYGHSYDDKGTKSTERILISELWFGKNADGINWISIVAPDRPKIVFDIKLSDYHQIYKGNGTPLTEAEGSKVQALSLIQQFRLIYPSYIGGLKKANPAFQRNSGSNEPTNGLMSFDEDIPY